jgi:hypothetical protein
MVARHASGFTNHVTRWRAADQRPPAAFGAVVFLVVAGFVVALAVSSNGEDCGCRALESLLRGRLKLNR